MTQPDFPMTPPMREAWQSMRKATWPGGTVSGGCRGLERLEDPFSELDSEDIVVEEIERFTGRERKVLPIILSLAHSLTLLLLRYN